MSTQSIESKLIDLGKWTIRSIQILGYLPISIRKRPSEIQQNLLQTFLHFKIRSFAVLFTLILLVSCTTWETLYFWNLKSYRKYVLVFGATEKYAYEFFVIVTSGIGLIFRITGLWNGHKTIQFWKRTCHTLEKVQTRLGYIKDDMLDDIEFRRIKNAQKLTLLFNIIFMFSNVLGLDGQRFTRTLSDETPWSSDTNYYLLSGLWRLMVLLHVLHANWLTFFLKLYTGAFKLTAKRIQSLENSGGFPGVIYFSEIFRIKKLPKLAVAENEHSGSTEMLETTIVRCMEAFAILEQEVHNFNNFFGGRLILEIVYCIINLIVQAFFISVWLSRGVLLTAGTLFVSFAVHLATLYRLGSVAGEMTLASQKVSTALFECVEFKHLSPEIRLKLQMLVSKIGNGPPVISARHFFVVNRHLVTSVLSAITTFLVVLVQFKDADNENVKQMFRPRFPSRPRMNVTISN